MFRTRTGEHQRGTGIWLLESKTALATTSLERHLLYLLGKLEPVAQEIRFYVESPGFNVDLLCYWVSATGHGGPVLSSHILKRSASLCNEFNFDYYGPYDEE